MTLQRGQIFARAVEGDGGSIWIDLEPGATLLRDSQSLISAASDQGNDGQVTINSPDLDLNAVVQPQDVSAEPPPELRANVCAPASGEKPSTFVRENRGGVVGAPDGYLRAEPLAGNAPASSGARVRDRAGDQVALAKPTSPSDERCL